MCGSGRLVGRWIDFSARERHNQFDCVTAMQWNHDFCHPMSPTQKQGGLSDINFARRQRAAWSAFERLFDGSYIGLYKKLFFLHEQLINTTFAKKIQTKTNYTPLLWAMTCFSWNRLQAILIGKAALSLFWEDLMTLLEAFKWGLGSSEGPGLRDGLTGWNDNNQVLSVELLSDKTWGSIIDMERSMSRNADARC